jgi:hypothetical protein
MFEPKIDPQLEALKTQQAEIISLLRSLLTKLEQQNTMLGSIGRFVREQSGDAPSFGMTR